MLVSWGIKGARRRGLIKVPPVCGLLLGYWCIPCGIMYSGNVHNGGRNDTRTVCVPFMCPFFLTTHTLNVFSCFFWFQLFRIHAHILCLDCAEAIPHFVEVYVEMARKLLNIHICSYIFQSLSNNIKI